MTVEDEDEDDSDDNGGGDCRMRVVEHCRVDVLLHRCWLQSLVGRI